MPEVKSFFSATRQDGMEAHHLGATIIDELESGVPHRINSSQGTMQSTVAMLRQALKRLHEANDKLRNNQPLSDEAINERENCLSKELEILEDFQKKYMTIDDEDPSQRSILGKFIQNLISLQDLIPSVIGQAKQFLSLRKSSTTSPQ